MSDFVLPYYTLHLAGERGEGTAVNRAIPMPFVGKEVEVVASGRDRLEMRALFTVCSDFEYDES